MAVLKQHKKSVRISGDFSVTINPVSKLDRYPISKVEDLFVRLRKGRHFSKLDLSQAYQQLPLDEHSKKYVVINTRRGLFCYLVRPNTAGSVEEKQLQQKKQYDSRAKSRTFQQGQTVFVKNFSSDCRWLPGRIIELSGPASCRVRLEDGQLRRRH